MSLHLHQKDWSSDQSFLLELNKNRIRVYLANFKKLAKESKKVTKKMNVRTKIPEDTRRKVLIEAGHRCAIPTCKQHPIDIHHIVPYVESEDNSFNNLIALCTQCHARFHRTREIDQKSLQIYKQNLGLLGSRYGEFERRVLHLFCENQAANAIRLAGLSEIQVYYLLKDGLLVKNGKNSNILSGEIPTWEEYQLTDTGKTFVEDWKQARSLE